jgi:polyisoprenoid-binding protein YceI
MALHKWSLDTSHSTVGFWIRHLMVSKIRGAFTNWTGTFELDEHDPGRFNVDVKIDAASIDTKEPSRDVHLRSADFFDVERFPHIGFRSTSLSRAGEEYDVRGELTIRGITRPVSLHVLDGGRARHPMLGDLRAGFSAHTSIQRADFGLTWNSVLESGGLALGDKVEIDIELQAFRPA